MLFAEWVGQMVDRLSGGPFIDTEIKCNIHDICLVKLKVRLRGMFKM